ncbi:MAG: glutamine--tRNA ligase/YqeY domain fusion protein [Pseudomonadales bacterium]|nr:glutamine--tRNA ligase/YqeY domain fusion protein [Pseudomonadales bacterium]
MDERSEQSFPDHFIAQRIRKDQQQGKHGGAVVTRFPPEPNGFLHLGHAKSICLNFGMAEAFAGRCNLRMDDTNPAKESSVYADAIERDVTWLGFSYGDHPRHASDYFERLFECAVTLIERGLAYVDSQDQEAIRAQRGTLIEPGTESPYRSRSVEENLALFQAMRAGDFEDGAHVLRAKIDMGSPNLNLRDPVIYRIRRLAHQRTGDSWCIYPMYDYTHCLSDAFEGITHSLCTLEFEDHRPLYDWVLDQFSWDVRPEQIEFSRLELEYTVLSKRHLNALVTEGHVAGWDDPRMPTLAGLRRRGVPPQALRDFCGRVGITKSDGTVEMALLERCIRDALESAPRALAVLHPLPVELLNYPQEREEWFDAPLHPKAPEGAQRRIPFSRHLFIERDDFMETPPKKYKRLSPGEAVRLRHGYVIRCERFDVGADGAPSKLYCTVDLESRAGGATAEQKVKGVIHWVSAAHALPAEVRLYDRLFTDPDPSGVKTEGGFRDVLNPDSLEVCAARLEPALGALAPGEVVQFERLGYFCPDPDSTEASRRFNRTITLRDTWGGK